MYKNNAYNLKLHFGCISSVRTIPLIDFLCILTGLVAASTKTYKAKAKQKNISGVVLNLAQFGSSVVTIVSYVLIRKKCKTSLQNAFLVTRHYFSIHNHQSNRIMMAMEQNNLLY